MEMLRTCAEDRLNPASFQRTSGGQIILVCASCAAIVSLAVWVGQLAIGGGLFLTSLISSAVIITTAPRSRQSHPTRVVLSHGIAMISGIALRSVLPAGPSSIALAVFLALGLILYLDALHPPALANAGIAFSSHATTIELLELTAATVAVLGLSAIVLARTTSGVGKISECQMCG